MTTLEVTVNLPDPIAREARRAGLLTDQAISRLIEEAVQRDAGKKLLDAMHRLRDAPGEPMTEKDVAEEIRLARAARKAAGEAGR